MSPLSENIAVSFGGLNEDSVPVDWCVQFDASTGWKEEILPAGVLPPRSAGHAVVYDSDTSKLVVSFGLAAGPTLLDDQWMLDFGEGVSGIWRCIEGTSPQCKAARGDDGVSNETRPARPPARAFAAGARVGLYHFLFGGLTGQEKQCAPGKTKQVLVGSDELWAKNVAYNIWFKVQQAGATPWARAFSQLASLNASGGYTNPTLLIGGANTSCELDDPPCSVWQPLNDVWLIDTAQAITSETDKECQFDGLDDVIAVHLPYWCSHVYSMGTLWLDMWAQPQMTGKKHKSILFDAYNGITSVLRWFLEFREDKLYAVLILNPGDGEVTVKRWGPIDRAIGFWRHYCFTLRFARFYSSTDEWTPSASIAQAFFFIDGEAVNEETSGSFLEIDLKKKLRMDQGLTAIYVGGPNPKVEAHGYRNFKGSADNIRVWWPACPHETDPSVCNPFAFLYPKRMDGRRQPSSGIPDKEVKMTHVARPVLDAMFSIKIADSETNGLIVAVGFDGTILVDHVEKMRKTGQNTVDNVADEILFQVQAVTDEDLGYWDGINAPQVLTCKGCSRQCTFETCQNFDIDCIKRGIEWNIERIAETGTCVCRDYKSCPEYLGCIMPTSSVLSVNVTDGGRGYKDVKGDDVKVTFEGGGGSGASAEAIIENGTIISVKVLTSGTGYISSGPIVKFSGGGVSDCSICSNTSCCASAIVGLQLEGLQAKATGPNVQEPSGGGDDTTGDEGGGEGEGGTTGEGGGSSGDESSGGTSPPGDDSCEFADNGVCDEPEWCDPGTDTTDCLSKEVFNTVDTNDDQCISKDEFDRNPRKPFCEDDIEWKDSYGDGCDAYARNPVWCPDAQIWAVNGKSALGRCCVCKNAREILFEDVTSLSIYDGCPGEISTADFDAFFWEACGDGNRGVGEECDDGNEYSGDGCSDACELESFCGDGTRDAGETCDDGNNDVGDGCSDTCTLESGYACDTDTPNVCESDSRRVLLNRASPPPLPSLNSPAGGGSRNSPAGGKGRGRNEKRNRPKRPKVTREDRLEKEARRRGRNADKMRPRPTEYKTGGGGRRMSEDAQCKGNFRGTAPVILNETTTNCFGDVQTESQKSYCTLNSNKEPENPVASVWQSSLPDSPTMNAKIYILSTADPKQIESITDDKQALLGCGVSKRMEQSVPAPGRKDVRGADTPTYSTFAGKLGSLLRVDFNSGGEPAVGVNLELQLDDSTFPVWQRRGGCYDYDDKHSYYGQINVTLCLRGKVGLYQFDAENQRWQKDGQMVEFFYPWETGVHPWMTVYNWDGIQKNLAWDAGVPDGKINFEELMAAVHPFSNTTREVEALSDILERADDDGDLVIDENEYKVLLVQADQYKVLKSKVFTTNVTTNSTWAALATSPCSDYEGTGVAGGDRVAILPWFDYGSVYTQINGEWVQESTRPKIVMGDGVFSRKPGLALSNRPAFKSIGDVMASRAVGSMKLRSGWRQLCPEQTEDQKSCEGNVASLGWCADITFTMHALPND